MISFDEKRICAYLCNKSLIKDFDILLNFYNEIARISLRTKDAHFMQIRLQWFIEAIINLYKDKKSGFPLVDDLLDVIKKYNLEQDDFIKILEARNTDKDYVPFNNIEEYTRYSQNTGGIFWRLVMKMYGGNKQEQEAAYLQGTIFALIGNVRNINFNNKRMHYNLVFNRSVIVKGKDTLIKEINSNVKAILLMAQDYLKKAQKIKIRYKHRRLLLLKVFSEGYISVIRYNLATIFELNPYKLPIKYKIKFVFKYILNF